MLLSWSPLFLHIDVVVYVIYSDEVLGFYYFLLVNFLFPCPNDVSNIKNIVHFLSSQVEGTRMTKSVRILLKKTIFKFSWLMITKMHALTSSSSMLIPFSKDFVCSSGSTLVCWLNKIYVSTYVEMPKNTPVILHCFNSWCWKWSCSRILFSLPMIFLILAVKYSLGAEFP